MKKRLSLVLLSAVIAMSALFCAMFAITSSAAETNTIRFELGSNGSASHSDGSSKTSYTETVNGYTLSVTGISQFYTGARDAKGNSCFKLGSSSKIGSFKFVAPDDVTKVIIYVAGYKKTAAKITVNGVSETISTLSDNGAYTAVEVDTTTNKTVTFSTASGGYRCMVNAIEFMVTHEHSFVDGKCECGETDPDYKPDCQHTNTTTTTIDASKTEDGYTIISCADCGLEIEKTVIPALGCEFTFHVPEGVTAPPLDKGTKIEEMPTASVPSAFEGVYSFAGWATAEIGEATATAPKLYKAGDSFTPTDDTHFYAVYSFAQKGGYSWQLVDNEGSLVAGVQVVIVAKDDNYAIGTTQNSNNRAQASITKSPFTFGSDVQVFTLEDGTVSGTFAFNTGSGYIHAASSSSNYLRTQTTKDANASWKITISSDGTATVVAQGTYSRNTLQYNQSSSLFACYSSASQKAIAIYANVFSADAETVYYTSTPVALECEHDYVAEQTKAPSCDEAGVETHTCSKCGDSFTVSIPKLGHDYLEEVTKAPSCLNEGEITFTCQNDGCGHSYTEVLKKIDHSLVENKCEVCNAIIDRFDFSISGVEFGNKHDDGFAMGANTNTFGGKWFDLVLKNYDKTYIKAFDLTGNACLKLGTGDTAAFLSFDVPEYVNKVVIYVASYKGETAKVNINGTEYVIGSEYSSDNGEYFAIEVDTSETKTVDLTTVSGGYRAMINTIDFHVEKIPTPAITGASLNAGKDLTLKYKVFLPKGENIADYRMVFTMNNKEYVVTTYTVEGDKYVFSFTGIAPQDIADLVSAYLYKADSEEAVAEKLDYSVVAFAKDFVNKYGNDASYADYLALLGNLLVYGQAAKNYTDYKVDEEIESVDGLTSTNDKAAADASVRVLTQLVEGANATFAGVGVRFDYVNRIYVRYEVRNDAEATVKAMMGGTELELEFIDGKWYTPALTATQFDETVTFTLSIDGVDVQTLTYSVNSYVVAKQESTNSEVVNLVVALYNYGTAAEKIAQSAQ